MTAALAYDILSSFVRYGDISGDGFRNLEKGERVRFLAKETPEEPKATEVSSAKTASAL